GLDEGYDHICCACGTGTTLAGLAMAKHAKKLPTTLHGIPMLAGGDFLTGAISGLYPALPANADTLHTGSHFGGYAMHTRALGPLINWFCAHTGILIEPVYTGKLFYAVFDLVASGYFKPGEQVLVIHTGGITGILGPHEQVAQYQNNI